MNTMEEIARSLGSIDATLKGINKRLADSDARHISHSQRLGALERWRSLILGMGIAAQAVWGVVFAAAIAWWHPST